MPDKLPITVTCAANAAYALPMTVMLTSLVCNLKTNRDVDIYIIESDIPDTLREKIETSVLQNKKPFYNLRIHWHKLDKDLIKGLPVAGHVAHITFEAYGRMIAPELLPANCRRVVCLDCDLVVLEDIGLLQDAADDRYPVAAVSNVLFPYVSTFFTTEPVIYNYVELGIPANNRYFQSGVMVINLDLWRKENLTTRIIEFLECHRERVYFHDQGGLNSLLFDQWFRLDQRWNQTTTVLFPGYWKPPAYSRSEWLKTKNEPYIVHYSGRDKPWNPGFKRPRSSFFHRYLKKTLFKDELKIMALESVIGFRNYYLLWRLKNWIRGILSKRRP